MPAFFIPGLFRPHDLGIKTSEQGYASTLQKLNLTKDKAPEKGVAEDYKYVYGTPKAVDGAQSSKEITSFLNVNRPHYYALKNALPMLGLLPNNVNVYFKFGGEIKSNKVEQMPGRRHGMIRLKSIMED